MIQHPERVKDTVRKFVTLKVHKSFNPQVHLKSFAPQRSQRFDNAKKKKSVIHVAVSKSPIDTYDSQFDKISLIDHSITFYVDVYSLFLSTIYVIYRSSHIFKSVNTFFLQQYKKTIDNIYVNTMRKYKKYNVEKQFFRTIKFEVSIIYYSFRMKSFPHFFSLSLFSTLLEYISQIIVHMCKF